MPYRNADKRVRKYELGVLPDNVRAKFESLKDFMVEQQQAMQAELTAVETAVKEILDDNGIIANMRVMYLNFARALFAKKGHNSGVALQKVAAAEKAKFVTYGLDSSILDQIIYKVIGAAAYS